MVGALPDSCPLQVMVIDVGSLSVGGAFVTIDVGTLSDPGVIVVGILSVGDALVIIDVGALSDSDVVVGTLSDPDVVVGTFSIGGA